MKNSIKLSATCRAKTVWIMLAIFLLFFTEIVSATPLTLEITSDKSNYLLGEPVYLTATLKNTGDKPVKIPAWFSAKTGDLRIMIIQPGGKQFDFIPLALLDTDIPDKSLTPGLSMTTVVPVFYGGRGWTFPSPGDYSIRATYSPNASNFMAISDKIKLSISNNKTDAGKYLFKNGQASDEAAKFLLWQSGDHLRKGIAHLKNLADRYPDSPINQYTWLAIGKNYSREFKDYSVNRIRKPDYNKAIKYLNRVNDKTIVKHLQIMKYAALSQSYLKKGDKTAARKMFNKASLIVQDNPSLQLYIKPYSNLEKLLR